VPSILENKAPEVKIHAMTFSGLNLIGVLVAFIVSFISGAIWFGPKLSQYTWIMGVNSYALNC
jgi:thiamine transporter ThiT